MSRNRKKRPPTVPERRKLEEEYRQHAVKYTAVSRRVLRRLQQLIAQAGMNASVRCRVKSFDSYFEKVLRLGKEDGARAQLTDIIGFRIICPFLSDLDEVGRLIHANFQVLEVDRKGVEHSFREFGYDSIHLLVDLTKELREEAIPCSKRVAEIQLRTILQDAWAEVEHELIYKSGQSSLHESIKRKLAALNATLTLSDVIFQEIREYQKEVQERDSRRKASIEAKLITPEAGSAFDMPEAPPRPPGDAGAPAPIQLRSEIDQLVFQALAAHSNDEFVKAIGIYSRVLRMKARPAVRSVIYNHRGMAYVALSQYQRARTDFTTAIRYNGSSFRAYNNRALVHRICQQYEQALADLDRSLEIDAVQAEGYYIRALTYLDLRNYSEALQDCERVLNIRPDFAVVEHLKRLVVSKISK